jgi:hypothetical protein
VQREHAQVLTLYLSQGSGREAGIWALGSDDDATVWLKDQLRSSRDDSARQNVRYVLSTRPVVVRAGVTSPTRSTRLDGTQGGFIAKCLYAGLLLAVAVPVLLVSRVLRRVRGS